MKSFTIFPNKFLSQQVQAYYHQDYLRYNEPGNPNFLNYLKNQFGDTGSYLIKQSMKELKRVLQKDLPEIRRKNAGKNLTVCVVPRAKSDKYYRDNQKLFREVVSSVVDEVEGLFNGTRYVLRHTNTRTTHMNKKGYGGDGSLPYVGITKDTCTISDSVTGKDILLIDDIYTANVNIDEDAIQALFDKGARSVCFYAIGKTVKKSDRIRRAQVLADNDFPF